MKKSFILIGTLFCMAFSFGANAQLHPTTPTDGEVDIIIGDKTESPVNVYNVLVANSPTVREYTNLPRFAIIGKDNKFYLSVGASIKATASFDWGNPLSDPSLFMPADFTPATPGNGGDLQFTVKRTLLSFNCVALPGTENQLGIYVNMNFTGNGNNYGAALKNAYIKYRGFTVGYKNTLYADGAACPYTIDSEGPNSAPGIWNTCLDYEHNFSERIQAGIGLELPLYSITPTSNSIYRQNVGKTQSVNQRIPDVPMYLQYNMNGKGNIRLAGVVRTLQYRDMNSSENKNNVGWGVKLSGYYNCGPVVAYWLGEYGRGIASYLQDNTGNNLDMVPDSTTPGEMQMTKSWGAYGALQFNYTKKMFSTVVYSQLRNYMDQYNGGSINYGDQYKWGQYIAANYIYSITPNIQTGIEYLYGKRTSFDGTKLHDNRIIAMLFMSF